MNKKLKSYLIIFFYTTAICIIVAEITLRWKGDYYYVTEKFNGMYISPYDETYMWPVHNRKNSSRTMTTTEFEYIDHYNSEGLRDIEHHQTKPENEYRILLLGDSYTQGFGSVYSDAWCTQLKMKIDKNSSNINIINGGFIGSDPYFSMRLFKDRLIGYDPDMLLLVINCSDVMDIMVRGGNERFLNDSTLKYKSKPKIEYLFSRSHLFRFVLMKIYDYGWLLIRPEETDAKIKESLTNIVTVINDFKVITQKNEIGFAVVFHPITQEVINNKYLHDFDYIKHELSNSNIEFFDLFTYFRKRMPKDSIWEYYWKDQHFNPKGNMLFAEGMENYLLSSGLMPND